MDLWESRSAQAMKWGITVESALLLSPAFTNPISGDDRPDVRSGMREEPAQAGGPHE